MYSIHTPFNSQNLEDFAISVCSLHDEHLKGIDDFARGIIINAPIHDRLAFEVVLNLKNNFSKLIRVENRSYRLVSRQDFLKIAKHAMLHLKTAFAQYTERLNEVDKLSFYEAARYVAGTYSRDPVVNLLTGSGIHCTNLTKLYYNRTKLLKKEGIKYFLPWTGADIAPIFYINSLPTICSINEVVDSIIPRIIRRLGEEDVAKQ